MKRRSRRSAVPFALALLLALALQVPYFGVLYFQSQQSGEQEQAKRPKAFVMSLARKKPVKKEEEVREPDGQVVELPDPPTPEKAPEDAKYLSKQDSKAEKETKAEVAEVAQTQKRSKTRVDKPSKVQSPDSKSPAETTLPEERPQMELPKPREDLRPSEFGSAPPKLDFAQGERAQLLLPSTGTKAALANIQALSGLSLSDDALPEVEEEALETDLNSKKFRYWDFFNRVKMRVRDEWSPREAYRKNDPSGRVHGVKDRLTVLKVTLDSRGQLVQLETEKDSGLDFLDSEARRAMRAAAPFANPPAGLVDERGLITFQFGFMFEISGKAPKFFWKRM